MVKVHRYGGQNSWWAASNVEGVLKLQWKRGARALRYEALREMRFHAIPNLENMRIRRATVRPPTQRNHHPKSTICVPALLMCSPQISANIPHFGI